MDVGGAVFWGAAPPGTPLTSLVGDVGHVGGVQLLGAVVVCQGSAEVLPLVGLVAQLLLPLRLQPPWPSWLKGLKLGEGGGAGEVWGGLTCFLFSGRSCCMGSGRGSGRGGGGGGGGDMASSSSSAPLRSTPRRTLSVVITRGSCSFLGGHRGVGGWVGGGSAPLRSIPAPH